MSGRQTQGDSIQQKRPYFLFPLVFILLLGMGVRGFYLWEVSSYANFEIPYRGLDHELYDGLARRVAGGDLLLGREVYHYSALYAYFLGGLYAIFGAGPWVARVASLVLGCGTIVLVYLLSLQLLRSQAAATSTGIGAALYGPYVVADTSGLKTSLALFLITLALLLVSRSSERESNEMNGGWFAPGLVLGLAYNVVGQVAACIVAFGAWLATKRDTPGLITGGFKQRLWTQRMRRLVSFIIGIVLATAPFALRNYLVAGELVLSNSTSGIHFYIGNHRNAWGGYSRVGGIDPTPAGHFLGARRLAEVMAGHSLTAAETSRFWRRKAVEYIRNEPSAFLRLLWQKVLLLVSHYEIPNNEHYDYLTQHSSLLRILPRAGLLLPLGLTGLLLSLKDRQRFSPLLLFSFSYSLVVIFTFVTWRYRLPLTLALWPFVGAFLFRWGRWLKTRQWGAALVSVASVLGLTFLTWASPVAEQQRDRDLRQAEAKMRASERALQRRGSSCCFRTLQQDALPQVSISSGE